MEVECPHCGGKIIIMEINCGIFRHAVYKDTFMQVNPHMPKTDLEAISHQIYGCGKPFRIIDNKPIICDYI